MLYENLTEFVTNEARVTLSDRMMKDHPRPDGLRDTDDRIAADWAKDHEGDTWWRECTARFASLLPQEARVLDAGVPVRSGHYSIDRYSTNG